MYAQRHQRRGARLRQARERSGLSQTMLARIARLHPSTIGRLERGEHAPRARTIRAIVPVLGITSDSIITDYDQVA
jgi:transcriptional regulator with XRE-family HTH domain